MNKTLFGPQEKLFTEMHDIFIEGKKDYNDSETPHADINSFKPINTNYEDLVKKPFLYSLIRKFYKTLRDKIPLYQVKRLEEKHYALIDDKSIFYDEKEESSGFSCQKYLLGKIKKVMISPYHPLRLIWSFIILCFTLFSFLLTSFETSFHLKSDLIKSFPLIGTTIFAIDIGITFITGTFFNGSLLLDPRKSIRVYLSELFIHDFLGLLGFIYWLIFQNMIENNLWMELGKILLFFKVKKLSFCQRTLSNVFKTSNYKGYIELIKVMGLSLIIAHFIACLWNIASLYDKENNWKTSLNLKDNDLMIWNMYIYSMYWAVTTMMTVGYGDVTAQNKAEILFSFIVIVFGCVVYAYNLNSVGMVLQDIYKNKRAFEKKIDIINNFMDRKRIDSSLQNRIQEYLHFIWMEQKNNAPEEEIQIINSLSESLRSELLFQSYTEIFEKFPLLVKHFSQRSLLKMISIIKEIKYTPGEEIFEEGTSDNCCLFYIIKGSVELFLQRQKNNIFIKELKQDECFGEYSFFTNKKHEFSCKTKNFTSIYAIPNKEFLEILRETPEDYESYCMIKDSLLLNNEQNFIRSKCFSCSKYTHLISQCPLIHYVPDKEKIIKKSEFYNDQERSFFFRKFRKRFTFKNIIFSAEEMQKNIEMEKKKSLYDDFGGSKVSLNIMESQNLESSVHNLYFKEFKENDEEKLSQCRGKNLDKASFHNLDILEKDEEFNLENEEEIRQNEEFSENSIDLKTKQNFTKISHNEKRFAENKLTQNRSQEYLPSMNSSENFNKIYEKKESNLEIKENVKKDVIFENMYHFQHYFPEMNYKRAIKAYEVQKIMRNKLFSMTKNLISSPKIINFDLKLKERIQCFNKFSFRTSQYKEMIIRTYEKKKLIPIRPNARNKSTVNMGILSRKKSFFKNPKFQGLKKNTFEDLISGIIKKSKNSVFKNVQ